MKLQACQNCWFNGLQYGSVGLPFGYCTRHRVILNNADNTTCGQHLRKDLGIHRAIEVALVHSRSFKNDIIVEIKNPDQATDDISNSDRDEDILRQDSVADAVMDYGFLDSKIGSLAQLKSIKTARSDIAISSLGRAYIRNCARNGGKWTSGIHLYWWTKNRISEIPELEVRDIRYAESINIYRQAELAGWSVMMLKLSLLDDILSYAAMQNDEIGSEFGIVKRAAYAVQVFNLKKLSSWIKKELVPTLDKKLTQSRYIEIAKALKDNFPNSED